MREITDVVPGLQHVSGEGVPQNVRRAGLGDPAPAGSPATAFCIEASLRWCRRTGTTAVRGSVDRTALGNNHQMGQERRHLGRAKLAGMALVMEQDRAPGPIHLGVSVRID